MSSNMKFIKISKNTLSLCDFCKINKTKTKFSRRSQNFVFEKNECIDVDLKSSIDSFIWDEKKYYCLMTCRVIKLIFVYLFAIKNEFYDTIEKHFMLMIKIQTFNHKIKRWRIDENDEFANNRTKKFFAKHDIQWEFSTLYVKKQNDIAKRKNYIVMIVVRVILKNNDLLWFLWNEILKIVIYLKNRNFVTRLRIQHVIFFETYFNVKSNVNHYRLIECDVWLAISNDVKNQKKLNVKEIKCKFLNYVNINQYRLWNLLFKRVIIAKNVNFDEFFMFQYSNKIFYWNENLKCSKANNIAQLKNDEATNEFIFDDDEIMIFVFAKFFSILVSNKKSNSKLENSLDSNELTLNENENAKNAKMSFDDRILHSNSNSNFTIIEREFKRFERVRKQTNKIRLNEQWQNLNNWDQQISLVVNKNYFENLVVVFEMIYCRQTTIVKMIDSNCLYDHDFDSKNDFRDFLELT